MEAGRQVKAERESERSVCVGGGGGGGRSTERRNYRQRHGEGELGEKAKRRFLQSSRMLKNVKRGHLAWRRRRGGLAKSGNGAVGVGREASIRE